MANLKVPYTRRSNFSYTKAYKSYAWRMKNCCNAVDGTFYDAINNDARVIAHRGEKSFAPASEFPGSVFPVLSGRRLKDMLIILFAVFLDHPPC